MDITRQSLDALRILQAKDLVLDSLAAQKNEIPSEIASLKGEIEAAKSALKEARAKTLDCEKRKKEKELELAAKEEAIRKHSVELNQVKTNEAFKALQSEIEGAKSAGSSLETRILEIMEEADQSRVREKKIAQEAAEEEKKILVEVRAAESRLAEVESLIAKAQAERDASAAAIDPELLKVYELIRGRGKRDAVVPVEGGHCGVCRMALMPQQLVESAKGRSLVVCESCQRILYRLAPAEAAAK
jgi:predicted  nucleic acid-binding Zn-ribbon protein